MGGGAQIPATGWEARLIALACSKPPEGYARWSLRLLESKVVELGIVEAASDSTIQRALKKNALKDVYVALRGGARFLCGDLGSGEFGPNNGAFPTFSALATLAYDCRHTRRLSPSRPGHLADNPIGDDESFTKNLRSLRPSKNRCSKMIVECDRRSPMSFSRRDVTA
jgi:hypothetical protein